MYYLELSAEHAAENLALDEALLQLCEEGTQEETLRIWESSQPFIVLGCGSKAGQEVDLEEAERRGVPVLRRISGGCTVLQAPGCLNYALLLRTTSPYESISSTNQAVMNRNRAALQRLISDEIRIEGFTDLALAGRKFSGNSQRRLKRFLLFHGTVLYRFDLALVEGLLRAPSRQPAYRRSRTHRAFLMNFPAERQAIVDALREAWAAEQTLAACPREAARELSRRKYGASEWNFRI